VVKALVVKRKATRRAKEVVVKVPAARKKVKVLAARKRAKAAVVKVPAVLIVVRRKAKAAAAKVLAAAIRKAKAPVEARLNTRLTTGVVKPAQFVARAFLCLRPGNAS